MNKHLLKQLKYFLFGVLIYLGLAALSLVSDSFLDAESVLRELVGFFVFATLAYLVGRGASNVR